MSFYIYAILVLLALLMIGFKVCRRFELFLLLFMLIGGVNMLKTLLFFVQGIPEIAGVVACSLALARVKLRWGVILVFASILTVLIYIIRNLPITFGLHTVAGILLCTLFIVRGTRVSPSTSFIVSFAGFALLALLEVIMYELIGNILNTEISQLLLNEYTRMLIGLPQALIMVAIALLISKYIKHLEGMWKI